MIEVVRAGRRSAFLECLSARIEPEAMVAVVQVALRNASAKRTVAGVGTVLPFSDARLDRLSSVIGLFCEETMYVYIPVHFGP